MSSNFFVSFRYKFSLDYWWGSSDSYTKIFIWPKWRFFPYVFNKNVLESWPLWKNNTFLLFWHCFKPFSHDPALLITGDFWLLVRIFGSPVIKLCLYILRTFSKLSLTKHWEYFKNIPKISKRILTQPCLVFAVFIFYGFKTYKYDIFDFMF